ncbi:MAG: ComEC/Rec2 family competence protein, partial [Paraglaciecola chathamensis]
MDGRLFSFIAASISAVVWSSLPALAILPIILTLAILLWCLTTRNSTLATIKSFVFCFLLGIFWMASVGHWQQTWQLQENDFKQGVWVTGKVQSLIDDKNSTRFNLIISRVDDRELRKDKLIRVSWARPKWPVKQGQVVQLWVKLKPPHGLANQGGFHYQQWLFSQAIMATGYVKAHENNVLLVSHVTVRQRLLDSLIELELTTMPWIAA